MDEYRKFLAEKVLNEKEPVTYRSLCRALNVHSNLSKQMLYDFHHHENSKKAKSVNATYLIIGIQREQEKPELNGQLAKDGEDDIMQSSPFMSSMPQQDEPEDKPKTTSVTLVREEDLDNVRSRFETIFSIHIHSLQPAPLQDLNILSDVGRDSLEKQLREDPLGQNNKHGMIQNKKVKRRTGVKVAAPVQSEKDAKAPKPAAESKASSKQEEPSQSTKKDEKEGLSSKSQEPKGSSRTEPQPTKKSAPSAREKSDIFKAFAKAKPKAKKTEPEPPATESTGASAAEEVVPDDASEEEREDLFSGASAKDSDKLRQERLERAENLKKMMEDDDDNEGEGEGEVEEDEEMPDAPESPPPEEEEPAEPVVEEPKKSEPLEEAEVRGGRRRGRRQVMKKKVVKDEEGYLVTREEPVWEEFSEEDKPPPKKKPAVSVKPPPKSSKGGGKAAQGNIMSFFSKK